MAIGCSSPARCSRCRRRVCRRLLRQRGIGWIEDPSNASPAFERVRLRAARAVLDSLGLTPGMLSLSARRLAAGARRARSLGGRCARSRRRRRRGAPVRFLQHRPRPPAALCPTRSSSACWPAPSPRRAEPASRCRSPGWRRSLARRCRSTRHRARGRWRAPSSPPRPTACWSSVSPAARPLPVLVAGTRRRCRLGWPLPRFRRARRSQARSRCARSASRGCARCAPASRCPPGLPVGSLRAVPSFWRGDHLLAVPPLGFWASADLAGLTATFLPLACPSGASLRARRAVRGRTTKQSSTKIGPAPG